MSTPLQPHHYSILIIGAGLQGLVAAKTYLQLNPSTSLLILDSNTTIGGVWAQENIYPDLKTNNQLGTFEFTDFDIRNVCAGKVKAGEHIPGDVVHEYLVKYAEKHDLIGRVRLKCKVTTAEHVQGDSQGGWKLTVIPTKDGDSDRSSKVTDLGFTENDTTTIITTSKLI
ncbi:MAG: hypothetical protein Q9224_007285, partial [Gallowayella concinna]